jgi:hypothetical protein
MLRRDRPPAGLAFQMMALFRELRFGEARRFEIEELASMHMIN